MTIRRGEEWGYAVDRPDQLRRATSDAELARWVDDDPNGIYGVADGDLHRSIGAPPDRQAMMRLPCDAMRVTTDTITMLAVAHAIVRRSWWFGRIVAVINADHVGEWIVAPRAHPNDGRIDTIDVAPGMTIRQRWHARHRLESGTHVPHPSISVASTQRAAWTFRHPHRLIVDGVVIGRVRRLEVEVLPDHFSIVV